MLTSSSRKLKRINIALGFIVFLLGISVLIFIFVSKPEVVVIKSTEVSKLEASLENSSNYEPPFIYDISVTVNNPNEKFKAKEIDYSFEVQDNADKIILTKPGKTQLEINEKKKLTDKISLNQRGETLHFKIANVSWNE